MIIHALQDPDLLHMVFLSSSTNVKLVSVKKAITTLGILLVQIKTGLATEFDSDFIMKSLCHDNLVL